MILPEDIIMTVMIVSFNVIGIIDKDALIVTIPSLIVPIVFWGIFFIDKFSMR